MTTKVSRVKDRAADRKAEAVRNPAAAKAAAHPAIDNGT